jgi:xylulokinase
MVRAAVSGPTPFVPRLGGGVEMEASDLEGALRELIGELGEARSGVAGVGVAGMAESGVPLAEGHPLGPILAWFDGRGEETASDLVAALGPELAVRIGQRVRSVSSVAKLGWLLADGMPLPQRWLGIPETVLYLLTDVEVTEHSLAARTGAYDVAAGGWIPEVTDVLGVAPDIFPAVARAGEAMAEVSAEAAAWYGLPAGVPVTIAGHDHLAAAEGVGADDDDILNSVGTAETLLRRTAVLPDLERSLDLGLAVTVRPGGRGWVVLASARRSGQVLEGLAAEHGLIPAELDALAAEVMAGSGSTAAGTAWAEALRDLVERSAGGVRRVTEVTGPAARLLVYGGGSRSEPWLALKARALHPLPVWRVVTPDAVARGAALAAGVAAGWWSSPAAAPPAALEPVGAPVPPASG